jgi:hypothetical protein
LKASELAKGLGQNVLLMSGLPGTKAGELHVGDLDTLALIAPMFAFFFDCSLESLACAFLPQKMREHPTWFSVGLPPHWPQDNSVTDGVSVTDLPVWNEIKAQWRLVFTLDNEYYSAKYGRAHPNHWNGVCFTAAKLCGEADGTFQIGMMAECEYCTAVSRGAAWKNCLNVWAAEDKAASARFEHGEHGL